MKLKDYRSDFYTYSGKASDLNRQLALAGIAVIWLFKKDTAGVLTIPRDLVFPGIFIILSLMLDMLQYCVASLIWRYFYRSKEKAGVNEETEITHSVWFERPIWYLFIAKLILVFLAYIWILRFLIEVLTFQ
jgi:hypothetical protein